MNPGRSRDGFVLRRSCAQLLLRLLFGLALLIGVLGLGTNLAPAQNAQPSEYQLKAAFIYHFAQFVEWPQGAFANDQSPFVIGILGDNPFGNALEQAVRGKRLNNRPLVVKALPSAGPAPKDVQILFISSSEKRHLAELLAGLQHASVLTVGETDHFLESGGIINFVREATKIRFQINEESARQAGLKISSKLLSLASPRS